MTTAQIREELNQIKYYYSRKAMFDKASESVGAYCITDRIGKYNEAVRYTSPRLYEVYVALYIENNTFDSLATKLGYSYDYIQKLNRKLVRYFQETFAKEGNE